MQPNCWIHTRKYEYYATLWIEKFFIMKYLVIDDNEKVHHLLKGRYENEDVLFYNANEAELRPDYDYRTLLAKSYTEITGNIHSHIFKNPKHKTISWQSFLLVDRYYRTQSVASR